MASFQSTGEYMILNDIALNTSTPLYVRAGSIIPVQKGNHTSTNDRYALTYTSPVRTSTYQFTSSPALTSSDDR